MSIMTIEAKVTRPYLMNKSKSDLAQWVLDALNEIERLRGVLEGIEAGGDCACDHDDENCCDKQDEYCPVCTAAVALR